MRDNIYLIAQKSQYNSGLLLFQFGMTVSGLAVLLVAGYLLFEKRKEGVPDTHPILRKGFAALFGIVGIGIIAYAWLAFSGI